MQETSGASSTSVGGGASGASSTSVGGGASGVDQGQLSHALARHYRLVEQFLELAALIESRLMAEMAAPEAAELPYDPEETPFAYQLELTEMLSAAAEHNDPNGEVFSPK